MMANLYLGSLIAIMWLFLPFLFDHLFLDGILKDKVKSWLNKRLMDSCNKDCNQGRCCTCNPPPERSGEILKTHKSFDPHAR